MKIPLAKSLNQMHEDPVYKGDRDALEMDISVIAYDSQSAEEKKLSGIAQLGEYKNSQGITWINISGLKDIASFKLLGETYDIHHLSVEDILNTEQQAKIEVFENYKFLTVKTVQKEKGLCRGKTNGQGTDGFIIDQISIIVMEKTIITIQETHGDSFGKIRKKILEGAGSIRRMGTDYIAYAIVDTVVDEYFIALDHLEDDIENFEDRAAKTSDEHFISEIQSTRKYLLQIKRAVLPLKENITAIKYQGIFFANADLKPFLHDLTEHLSNVIITVDHHREWLSGIMDLNLSVLSHQTNKVMKVLAMISTIFIPLSFIAGIYGMNFASMPELEYRFGYPIVLAVMGTIATVMVIVFKIRKWF